MADRFKILAQAQPTPGMLTDVYTVAGKTGDRSAEISKVVVANLGSAIVTVSIAVAIGGAADTLAQYIVYRLPISPANSFTFCDITMSRLDVLRVQAFGSVAVNVFGHEIIGSGS